MTAFVVPLNSSEPDTLTKEEQELVGKGAIMQMYKPDEHSRHFIAHIDSATEPQTGKTRKIPKDSQKVVCFVLGLKRRISSLRHFGVACETGRIRLREYWGT
jgi:hypothetical protein